jgi:hypothetical protein
MTVMMRAGLGVGLDGHGARPQFLRADAGEIDRGLAVHPGGRGHVGIELVAGNDADAVMLPALGVVVIMRVIVTMAVIVRMTGMGAIVRACHLLLSENFWVANGNEDCVGNPDEKELFACL